MRWQANFSIFKMDMLRKHGFDVGNVPGVTILIVLVFYIIITMTF